MDKGCAFPWGSIPRLRSIPPVSSSTGEHAEPIEAAGKREGFRNKRMLGKTVKGQKLNTPAEPYARVKKRGKRCEPRAWMRKHDAPPIRGNDKSGKNNRSPTGQPDGSAGRNEA